MTPDLVKRLVRVFPSLSVPATGVADVAGVAEVARYAQKARQLRPLRPLHEKTDKREVGDGQGVGAALDAIAERRAIVAETCPAICVDVFARLNHQKPSAASVEQWRVAVNDAGVFLDAWGALAKELGWTAGDLFKLARMERGSGLIWRLGGKCVNALGPDHARLGDGRLIMRSEERK